MRYIFSICALLLCIQLFAQIQPVIVKGKVFDSKTNEPLQGVQVSYGKNQGTITDSIGYFKFSCNTGKIELYLKYIGYQAQIKKVNPYDNKIIELNIALEPVLNELEEIVVSANKTEQKISELSVSLNIIKPYDITKNHIVKAEEIINQTQGIEVMDGQASIRGGSGFSYGAGSRVLALIDGLPALSADAGNISWQFLPLENLSQIEVIKGASSVLYGSSALNGIINFRTADADTVPRLRFSVSSGIYDKPKQKNWVWWNSPRMCSDASFSFSNRVKNTELGIGSNLLLDNGYRKLNDEKLGRINLRIKQHSAKYRGLTFGASLNGGYDLKQDFILWEDAEFGALKQSESTAIELHGTYFTFDPFISIIRSDKTGHDLRMRLQIAENKYPDNDQNNSQSMSNYTEYQLHHQLFEKLDFIFGASHTYSKITSNFFGNHLENNIASYTQIDLKPIEKLKISGGLRLEYNWLDGIKDKLVPIFRTGINYRAAQYTFIRASFGQGYRYPSIAEKHAFTSLGAVKIYPNPEIRPESGWSSEIGVKQGLRFGNLIGQSDVSVFYSENTDMIEYIFGLYPDPITQINDFGFRATNIENSRVYGAETELMLNKHFSILNISFGGGYTYIYPVEFNKISHQSTETFLKYRRKHTAKFFVDASIKKFDLGFNLFYKSKVLNIDEVFLDPLIREKLLPGFYDYWLSHNTGSFVIDGYISYQINQMLKLSFGVKNLSNTEYMGRPGDILAQRFYSLQISGRF